MLPSLLVTCMKLTAQPHRADQQQQEQPPCCLDIFLPVRFTHPDPVLLRPSHPLPDLPPTRPSLTPRTASDSLFQVCLCARQLNDWRFNKLFTSLLTIYSARFLDHLFFVSVASGSSSLPLLLNYSAGSLTLYSSLFWLHWFTKWLLFSSSPPFSFFVSRHRKKRSGETAKKHSSDGQRRVLL